MSHADSFEKPAGESRVLESNGDNSETEQEYMSLAIYLQS